MSFRSATSFRSGANLPSQRPSRLADERVEEPPTPSPHPEERPEENHGVDALPPLSLPIHVLQPEPERELVQRQRRADAVEQRREPRRPVQRPADPGADLREPEIADTEQEEDAQHDVVK